jgi:hypothetical protein
MAALASKPFMLRDLRLQMENGMGLPKIGRRWKTLDLAWGIESLK